jgi:serine/threonine protein kinase
MTPLDPVRWRAASAELDRVLELSADERAPYLASLRGRDATLAADVESLLDDQRAADEARFLQAPPQFPASDATTRAALEPPPSSWGPGLESGTAFGPYRIVGLLGRGGMGVVYEAEEIDSGRRVALKVLDERLDDQRERERFDREGRLAASINHPHCVFVFAAFEVDGRPAIAMELMRGTLADRLARDGPLPVADAVDAALDLVAGLKAAADAGILHRDVKPSNCFVDGAGRIKTGDFGISRSVRPTAETALSTRTKFAATPAYASPEQLRGAPLDLRADIYSLGATLYELLTGRRPFERPNLMALLMAVANDVPRPPQALIPAIPKGLSLLVLRCLTKEPEQRFADYDALAAALQPYSSTAPTPAALGRRCLAGLIDHFLIGLPFMATGMLEGIVPWLDLTLSRVPLLVADVAAHQLYFSAFEGLWAATPGKALCGLTVVHADGRPARTTQILARAALYPFALSFLDVVTLLVRGAPTGVLFSGVADAFWLMFALLFSTARRRNGYAGLHDLLTRTRVVGRRQRDARPSTIAPASPAGDVVGRLEGFEVLARRLPGMPDGWHAGFDSRLRRHVWIRRVAPGTPPISPVRRAINRPTRLRWLAGRRNDHEAWDAFEAVAGQPLIDACSSRPREWSEVRWWLLDLARECAATAPDDHVRRQLDRVWVLDSGGAKLVDDPALDAMGSVPISEPMSDARFLRGVAIATRSGAATSRRRRNSAAGRPWPPSAQALFERLEARPAPDAASIEGALRELTTQRAVVTRWWRALPIAVTTFPTIAVALLGTAGLSVIHERRAQVPLQARIASAGLRYLEDARRGVVVLPPHDREALETALMTDYRRVLTDARLFGEYRSILALRSEHRALADDLLRRRATDQDNGQGQHGTVLPRLVERVASEPPLSPTHVVRIFGGLAMVGFVCTAILALAAAATTRGGVMRLSGLELVRRDGRVASRLRVVARTALVWSPVLLTMLVMVRVQVTGRGPNVHFAAGGFFNPLDRGPFTDLMWVTVLLILLGGAVVNIARPSRGIQDWLAGTWIVPR